MAEIAEITDRVDSMKKITITKVKILADHRMAKQAVIAGWNKENSIRDTPRTKLALSILRIQGKIRGQEGIKITREARGYRR